MHTPDSSPSTDATAAAGQFGRDMAALRQSHGISLEALHRQTRISLGILEEFESSGLAHNTLFNRVYLRSFIITYARVVGIDEGLALESLELALAGTYAGEMSGEKTEATGGETDPDQASADDQQDSPEQGARPVTPVVTEQATALTSPQRRKLDFPRRFQFEPLGTKTRLRKEISTAVHDFREPTQHRGLILPHGRVRAALFIVAIVVISVSAAVLAFRLTTRDTTQPANQAASGVVQDEPVRMEPRPPEAEPVALPPVSLGDSIAVTVIAADGPLDPIRIRVDRDLRRPFWVVEGDSMTFHFRQRMTLEELLDLAVVKVEGTTYPRRNYRADTLLVLDRDKATAIVQAGRRR